MLLENIADVQFIRPSARNQSELICFSHGQGKTVEKSFQNTYDRYHNTLQAAKIVRREILAKEKCQFNGCYNGLNFPMWLELLFCWILCGPTKDSEKMGQKKEIEKLLNTLS